MCQHLDVAGSLRRRAFGRGYGFAVSTKAAPWQQINAEKASFFALPWLPFAEFPGNFRKIL
jgi:hypothetical protein